MLGTFYTLLEAPLAASWQAHFIDEKRWLFANSKQLKFAPRRLWLDCKVYAHHHLTMPLPQKDVRI